MLYLWIPNFKFQWIIAYIDFQVILSNLLPGKANCWVSKVPEKLISAILQVCWFHHISWQNECKLTWNLYTTTTLNILSALQSSINLECKTLQFCILKSLFILSKLLISDCPSYAACECQVKVFNLTSSKHLLLSFIFPSESGHFYLAVYNNLTHWALAHWVYNCTGKWLLIDHSYCCMKNMIVIKHLRLSLLFNLSGQFDRYISP